LVVIDELPRTPSGKVKKEALRQRLREAADGGG
jgi:acyl-coenzyme A synthetase/AMP-(fatty) acid ligase